MNVNTAQSVAHKLMNPDIWDGKLYARGWKRSQNGTAQVTDKSTGEILATAPNASVAEIREASNLAVSAGEQWAKVSSLRHLRNLQPRCHRPAAGRGALV